MPLRAILEEQELLAPLLSDEEWEELKRKKVKVFLPCCEARGYLRTSKRGIKHFVHSKKNECKFVSETWQHLLCKTEIAQACKAMGYDVKTEASGVDWRADVLATKQGKNELIKLAFEVQWSHQTLKETEERQQKYIRDGIRCCWLFENLPVCKPRQDIPMFQLSFGRFIETEIPNVITKTRRFKLFDFVTELLSHHFRFCEFYRYNNQQSIRLRFFPVNCWKCKQEYYIYHTRGQSFKSICGDNILYLENGNIIINPEFLPEIVNKAYEYFNTRKAQIHNIKIGTIKSRYSKTVGSSYTSFGCPYCDVIFGEHFYFDEIWSVEHGYIKPMDFLTTVNISLTLKREDISHWCYSPDHNFCCSSNP